MLAPCQYCHQLLLSATQQQREQAASMTAEDWSEYWESVVGKMCLIKQLQRRHGDGTALPESAARTPLLPRAMSNEVRAATAAAATGTPHGLADMYGSTTEDLTAALNKTVDDLILTINLSMVHDSIPIREAALRNLLTKEITPVIKPEYWKRVVDSLHLTSSQVGGSSSSRNIICRCAKCYGHGSCWLRVLARLGNMAVSLHRHDTTGKSTAMLCKSK